MRRADRYVAGAIAAWAALLLATPFLLAPARFKWFFSEHGPVESASPWAWVVAALVVLAFTRPLGARAAAFALLYLAFAAREADWHKAYTADSMLKTSYYRSADVALGEKLASGLVALVLLCLLAWVLWSVARFLIRERGWRTRAGAWLLVGFALLFFTKLLDRTPATLEVDYGVRLAPRLAAWFSALEEGLELALPLVLAWSAWIDRRERRYLSRPPRRARPRRAPPHRAR